MMQGRELGQWAMERAVQMNVEPALQRAVAAFGVEAYLQGAVDALAKETARIRAEGREGRKTDG